MPLFGKRRRSTYGAPRYGRKKLKTRRYAKKAYAKSKKPARFRYSRAANRLNTAVARTIRGMAESKVIPFRNQEWVQPQQTPGLGAISAVKFVAGQTPVSAWPSYTATGGFNAPQGDTKNNRDGQFIWLKGSTVNLTVNMDHSTLIGRPGAISFRVIMFKSKRAMDPTGTSQNPDSVLFLTNNGGSFGDGTAAPNNMNPLDMMLQPPNTNSFHILSDRKFSLAHTQLSPEDPQALRRNLPSYKNLRYNLRHQTKARIPMGGTDEPVDYNYRFGFAVFAYYPNQEPDTQADTPLGYSVSLRGTTIFNDV